MKFPLLPLGARFEYDGAVYVKTGPLVAEREGGGSRIIPRHAVVRVLDGAPAPAPREEGALPAATVREAVEGYHRRCRALLEAEVSTDRLGAVRVGLEAAREACLREAGLEP